MDVVVELLAKRPVHYIVVEAPRREPVLLQHGASLPGDPSADVAPLEETTWVLQPPLVDRVLSALLAPGTWACPMAAAAPAAAAAQQEGQHQTDLDNETKRDIADLAEAMLLAPDCLERARGSVNSERTSAFVQLRFEEEAAARAQLQQERPEAKPPGASQDGERRELLERAGQDLAPRHSSFW